MNVPPIGDALKNEVDQPYDIITFGDMCVDLLVSGGDIVPRFGQEEQLVDDYTLEM